MNFSSLVLMYEVLAVSKEENKDLKSKLYQKVCREQKRRVNKFVVSFSLWGAWAEPYVLHPHERFARSIRFYCLFRSPLRSCERSITVSS